MIKQLKNLSETDLDLKVLRYLTFPKFISMLTYQALWFPKLNILRDKFEGGLPFNVERKMREDNEKWKKVFNSSGFHDQIDNWPDTNVRDGRELTVVNCWFLGEAESQKMWDEYVDTSEGVVVKSSIRKLGQHVCLHPDHSQIGKVTYIDFSKYTMPARGGASCDPGFLLLWKQERPSFSFLSYLFLNFTCPASSLTNFDHSKRVTQQLRE